MKLLPKLKTGWKKLDILLEAVRAAVNERTVSGGAGIDVQSSATGVVISEAAKASQKTSSTDPSGTTTSTDASGGAWLTIDVMSADCVRSTIQVWSKPGV
jgi:hypothetical protein